jgi:D-glycerate 3-kinase
VNEAAVQAFLAEHGLPETFRHVLHEVCLPLAARAGRLNTERGRTVVIGLCGAQGSGKSTIAAAIVALLASAGRSATALSLDDVYLPRAARDTLAREVHPMLVVRGPPGTHDVAQACAVLDALHGRGEVAIPAFDKAADEPLPAALWRKVQAPVDVVVLEGWCVGSRPQPFDALAAPINALEAEADPDGRWRRWVNDHLAGEYQGLFARLDDLVLLRAPGFEVVLAWRAEQERKLIARTGQGMSDAQLARFVQHYERLTRWNLAEMPTRAGLVIPLDATRAPA